MKTYNFEVLVYLHLTAKIVTVKSFAVITCAASENMII